MDQIPPDNSAAQEYAREVAALEVAAHAFTLAEMLAGVRASTDDEVADDADFAWLIEQATATGVTVARVAQHQRETHYHQAQVGRKAAARVARLRSDPDYAARRAAREYARYSDPDDVAADVGSARASGAEPTAYMRELARVHEWTTQRGESGYRPDQDPVAVADDDCPTPQ